MSPTKNTSKNTSKSTSKSTLKSTSKSIGRARSIGLAAAGPMLLAGLWELVKALGGKDGKFLAMSTDDVSMPHVATILGVFGDEDVRGSGRSVWQTVLSSTWYTFRVASAGFVLGIAFGILLAMVMQRIRVAELALLPYVVLSQTIPLIVLAPLVVVWGGQIKAFEWKKWMAVAVIASYLAFFPIAVGALRGFQSPKAHSLELMDSYAASWWQTFTRLRLPSSIPFLVPALRLAAAASVVGAIVGEISTGLAGGIGRLILEYYQSRTGAPGKVFAAFFGAALLGILAAGIISLFERVVTRNRPKGVNA